MFYKSVIIMLIIDFGHCKMLNNKKYTLKFVWFKIIIIFFEISIANLKRLVNWFLI